MILSLGYMANELNIRCHVTGTLSMYHSMFHRQMAEQVKGFINCLQDCRKKEGEREEAMYLFILLSTCLRVFSGLIYCHHVRRSCQAKRILECHNAIVRDKRLQRVNQHFHWLSNSRCILFKVVTLSLFFAPFIVSGDAGRKVSHSKVKERQQFM